MEEVRECLCGDSGNDYDFCNCIVCEGCGNRISCDCVRYEEDGEPIPYCEDCTED